MNFASVKYIILFQFASYFHGFVVLPVPSGENLKNPVFFCMHQRYLTTKNYYGYP